MNWHEYFFDMCALVAKKSKDQSTKCGAVIVGPGNEVRSTGYNSFPRGINDDIPERQQRPEKYMWIEHAERNAIFNAARVGVPLVGCRIYQDWLPCTDCARAIIQCGISQIVVDNNSPKNGNKEWAKRWGDSLNISIIMLEEAGIEVNIYDRKMEMLHQFGKTGGLGTQ